MPTASSSRASAPANRLGQGLVAGPAERRHRRPLGERPLQPRNAAALLVHAHPERELAGELLRVDRHLGHLPGRFDVALEQDDAAEVELAGEGANLLRERLPIEADDDELADLAVQGEGHLSIIRGCQLSVDHA